ncbi:MAG: dehydrogenase [Bacteroidetes bacterium]|jgi:threonine dehydrogenase-like Zn-dependent dehydrogenase|nr:dehydrogenase [Bacteroidota bacterium]
MKINELWHRSKSETIIQSSEKELTTGQLLLKSQYSLISQGTEKLVAQGLIPKELHHDMKVPYMQGEFTFPCMYGYSLVGTIIDGNEALTGKMVHVLHPHADYTIVNQQDVFEIPSAIPPERAVLASNMETVLNAVWDGGVAMGDRVLISGFGMIGALLAITLKNYPELELFVHEVNQQRKQFAASLGLDVITTQNKLPDHVDIAFNCSASEEGLQTCINYTSANGTIVEMSWYGQKPVQINLGGTFHYGRKRIISSQVSRIPLHKQAQWDVKRRKELVFKLLKQHIYDKLITKYIHFNDVPGFFNDLRQNKIPEPGVVIQY